MTKKSDSILGCAALLRDAENHAAKCFTYWTEANNHYRELLDQTERQQTSALAFESAWLKATASYEAYLDSRQTQSDLRLKLNTLKSADLEKRGKRNVLPVRQLPAPISGNQKLETYCQHRAKGLSPLVAKQMSGAEPSIEWLESEPRILRRITALKLLRDGEST